MKHVIYINCFSDPWIKVAQQLEKSYGFKPVYWAGYDTEDNSRELVAKLFPGCMYQDTIDGWKGLFPQEIVDKASDAYLDIDFLRKHATHELQAIKMMDRLDIDRRSFNFMERQRHFRNLVKLWTAGIELLKPDLVITTAIPHRLFDYVLFWLCVEKNIPFINFDHMPFMGRFILMKNNFFSINNMFVDDFNQFAQQKTDDFPIAPDVLKRFEAVKGDYSQAIPTYMVAHAKNQKAAKHYVFSAFKRAFSGLFHGKALFGRDGALFNAGGSYYKRRDKKVEDTGRYSTLKYGLIKLQNNKFKKNLEKHYNSLTKLPDYNTPYVVYFLHYQPEATTCPTGDIFVDQRLCIEMFLKSLPSNYMVYVKEHPTQFMINNEGHTSRMADLYDDLVKNSRVRLISTSVDTFELIDHSKGIGTVCGTVGWESIVHRKPVVLFGVSWYENYTKGVLRIKSEENVRQIREFIENYEYDEHALKAYLAAVSKNTSVAYYFKTYGKDTLNMSEDDCINNITKAIIKKIEE